MKQIENVYSFNCFLDFEKIKDLVKVDNSKESYIPKYGRWFTFGVKPNCGT